MMEIDMTQEQHTDAYNSYKGLLIPKLYEFNHQGKILYYNPKEDIDHYHISFYLRDDELKYINQERAKVNCTPIKRLAYIGQGKYIECASQSQRHSIEYDYFTSIPSIKEVRIDNVVHKVEKY